MHRAWGTTLVLTALAFTATGCGGDDGGDAVPALEGTDDPAAVKVAQAYVDGYATKDARDICATLAESIRSEIAGRKTCERAVGGTLKGEFPELQAARSYRTGDRAIVTFDGSPRQVTLQREAGSWKVINGGT